MQTNQIEKQEKSQANSQIILGIIFLILGGFFAWLTCHDVQAGLASDKFLPTAGTITSFNDGGGRRVANFAYSYKVNGSDYVNYLDSYPLPSVPRRKYASGESVTVFYDPAAPSHACLKQGLDLNRVTGMLLFVVASLAGGVMCIGIARKQQI